MVSSLNRYSPLLIAAMLLVGSNVGIGKSIVAYVPVPRFALLRFVIATAVLWPLFRVHKLRRVKRGEWLCPLQPPPTASCFSAGVALASLRTRRVPPVAS